MGVLDWGRAEESQDREHQGQRTEGVSWEEGAEHRDSVVLTWDPGEEPLME